MRKTMLIVSLATIAGCTSPLKQKDKSVEYGEYPKNYSEIVRSYYQAIAGDPNAIRFNVIHTPRSFSVSDGLREEIYGYIVCADLNFKTSDGKYTGHHTDGLLINNGRIVHFIEKGQWLGKSVC